MCITEKLICQDLYTQRKFTSSNSIIETSEKGVKCDQS